MSVYFIFSDEVGDYYEFPSKKTLSAHPYFIRSGVLIHGESWSSLRDSYIGLLEEHRFPLETELKWSYIGSIIALRKRGEPIPEGRSFATFRGYSNEELLSFIKDTVNLFKNCDYCRIIFTVTNNRLVQKISRENIYKWHIQDLMQRTEYKLQNIEGLAVMFLDPKDEASDSAIRDAYVSIYHDGDFIKKYLHIADSLTFMLSKQSFGIRIADYVTGIFNGCLREFQESTELFVEQVWPLIRKNPIGDPLGWGICEVPSNNEVRNQIRERLVAVGLLPEIEEEALF